MKWFGCNRNLCNPHPAAFRTWSGTPLRHSLPSLLFTPPLFPLSSCFYRHTSSNRLAALSGPTIGVQARVYPSCPSLVKLYLANTGSAVGTKTGLMRCHCALHNPIKCQGVVKSMNGTIYYSVFTGVATKLGLTANKGIWWAKRKSSSLGLPKLLVLFKSPTWWTRTQWLHGGLSVRIWPHISDEIRTPGSPPRFGLFMLGACNWPLFVTCPVPSRLITQTKFWHLPFSGVGSAPKNAAFWPLRIWSRRLFG